MLPVESFRTAVCHYANIQPDLKPQAYSQIFNLLVVSISSYPYPKAFKQ